MHTSQKCSPYATDCNVSFDFVTGVESSSKGPETINGLVPLTYTILVHRLAPQLSPVDKFEAAIGRSSNIKFNSNMKIINIYSQISDLFIELFY